MDHDKDAARLTALGPIRGVQRDASARECSDSALWEQRDSTRIQERMGVPGEAVMGSCPEPADVSTDGAPASVARPPEPLCDSLGRAKLGTM